MNIQTNCPLSFIRAHRTKQSQPEPLERANGNSNNLISSHQNFLSRKKLLKKSWVIWLRLDVIEGLVGTSGSFYQASTRFRKMKHYVISVNLLTYYIIIHDTVSQFKWHGSTTHRIILCELVKTCKYLQINILQIFRQTCQQLLLLFILSG